MDVKLVILLCFTNVAFASDFYNYGPVGYKPYYAGGGYPIETQEEYEYYDQSYGHPPVPFSGLQPQQLQFADYNARVGSPAVLPTAAPVASNIQVTNVPVQAAQPAVVSTTPVPLTNVNVASYQQQVPVVTTTVAPILSKSYQLGLVYPHTGLVPANFNNVATHSGISSVHSQSVINATPATPTVYSTTQSPVAVSNVAETGIYNYGAGNLPAVVASRSNVVSVPYPNSSPYLNNVDLLGRYNLAFNQGTSYNSFPTLFKSNIPYGILNDGNLGGYVSNSKSLSQNVYVPSIVNQALNNGNFYSSTLTKSNVPLPPASGIWNQGFYSTTSNPIVQNIFGSGISALSQSHIQHTGNAINANTKLSQPVVSTISPAVPSNVISFTGTTSSPFNGFVPVTSTYSAIKKQTVFAAPITSQSNVPSLYYTGGVNPAPVPSNTLLHQDISYSSVPISTISPSVYHNGSPIPVIYSTTSAPIVTTVPVPTTTPIPFVTAIPVPTTVTQESFSHLTTTPTPVTETTQKPFSSTFYTTNKISKVSTAPTKTQSIYDYASNTGAQSTTTVRPSTIQKTTSKVSFSTVNPTTQTSNYVPSSFTKPSTITASNPTVSSTTQLSSVKYPLTTPSSTPATSYVTQSSFSTQKPVAVYNNIDKQNAFSVSEFYKPTTYRPALTNNYVSSSFYNKAVQSTYSTPAAVSTVSYATQPSYSTPKPTVSYNTVSKQDAFTAALSGFSKPSTTRPLVTNNYASSSSIYNKGIQNTYTTPASVSTVSYATQPTYSTPKPTVSYNTVSKQNAFTAALSGFSKPSTTRPLVTNNYASSSSIYNKGIQSTYTTPASVSTVSYATQPTYSTPKPTVSYNTVSKQNAFTAALSGFSNPSTSKPVVTNNYGSSSSIYNKGIQSTYTTPASVSTVSYATQPTYSTPKPTVSYNTVSKQDAFTAALSGFSKPSTTRPLVTNNYASSSSIYNKGIQSTYTTPASVSTVSYVTQPTYSTPKPTVSYNTVNKQDAFTAALSGFSNPSTLRPVVTNNYGSSSSIYNKGIQSTYTTPASVSTVSYATQPTYSTPKPTVSYNTVSKQNAFTAALSGFSNPSTLRPVVTNNYGSSSSIYNKGIQSTYTTPASVSTVSYATQPTYSTPKPTVSYNTVSKQDAFTAALSGFSNPSTLRPVVTNNYGSSSSIYNKGIQSTYTTPASVSTVSYATQPTYSTPKPTVSYNTVSKQNAFTAALSGFSNPSTLRPLVTNNYASSSSIYNKGIQSTYTTPASVSTVSYATQPTYSTPKPNKISYNIINKQDAFTAALAGFSKPTTYRPVTNNYFSSSTIYNKGIQSTYITPKPPVSYLNQQSAFAFSQSPTYKPSLTNKYFGSSIYNKGIQNTYIKPATYTTQFRVNPTQKPTVSYNNINNQNAFTAAISEFSVPTTYKPSTKNEYTSSIYNKGIQSTYSIPATYTGSTYKAQTSSIPAQKPTVSYNIVNKQNAFAAALSGFSKPTTYRTPVTDYIGSTTVFNKGSQSTYTTPAPNPTVYTTPSTSVYTTVRPVTQSYNTGFVKTTSFATKPSTISSLNTQTGNVVANTYQPSKTSFSRPTFATNLYPKNSAAYNFNSLNRATNSVFQTKVNQFVPFVNIPSSTKYISATVQRKEFVPVASYQGGLNVIVQPPVLSETGTTVVPSILDYSSTFITPSSPPPEAISNFVHNKNYLPPTVVPAVSDVASNGIVTLISEPVVTSTVAPPIVVETTPRTLPLSYETVSEEVKAVPNSNQVTVKPIVYTSTPVVTKIDVSPTLIPVAYSVPVSTEYVQVSTDNPLSYSTASEATTVDFV